MSEADAVMYLVRHGRTSLNASGAFRGRLDPPLDEIGMAEAEALAGRFDGRGVTAVVSSPLLRARQTAEPIAAVSGVTVEIDDRFVDRDYGPWASTTPDELHRRFGSVDDAPGVETRQSLSARALEAVTSIVGRDGPAHIVIVAHEALNRTVLSHLVPALGDEDSISQRTGCWNRLDWSDGHWIAVVIDSVPAGEAR